MENRAEIIKKRCPFGHYYDRLLFRECPHCRSMRFTPVISDEERQTVARLASFYVHGEEAEARAPAADTERSVSRNKKPGYFVTGWLVCIGGPETGRCFNLYHGENTVGRPEYSTVCLAKDPSVTEDIHCTIEYRASKAVFYLIPFGKIPVFVDGHLLKTPVTLETGNVIRVGNTLMEFVAFCVGEHKWNRQ